MSGHVRYGCTRSLLLLSRAIEGSKDFGHVVALCLRASVLIRAMRVAWMWYAIFS